MPHATTRFCTIPADPTLPIRHKTPRDKKPPVNIHDFSEQLRQHVWSHDATSFYEFTKAVRAEEQFFAVAIVNGPDHMQELFYRKNRSTRQAIDDAVAVVRKQHDKALALAKTTGDIEFDTFRKQVDGHDWYYSFSDDHSVWKAGNRIQSLLEETARTHGGIFQTYYDLVKSRQST